MNIRNIGHKSAIRPGHNRVLKGPNQLSRKELWSKIRLNDIELGEEPRTADPVFETPAEPGPELPALTGWTHFYWADGASTGSGLLTEWEDEMGLVDIKQQQSASAMTPVLRPWAAGATMWDMTGPASWRGLGAVAVATQPITIAVVWEPISNANTNAMVLSIDKGASDTSFNTQFHASLTGTTETARLINLNAGVDYKSTVKPVAGAPHIAIVTFDGTSSILRVDGVEFSPISTGTLAPNGTLVIGASNVGTGSDIFYGYIGMVGILEGVMSVDDAEAIEAEAATKYGVVL